MAQCKARSKQHKGQCKRHAVPGAAVCIMHGGGAPQVRKKAAERLAALVDPAIDVLNELLKAEQENTRLGAVKDVLDRNGLKQPEKLELTGQGGEKLFDLSRISTQELENIRRVLEQAVITNPSAGGDSAI